MTLTQVKKQEAKVALLKRCTARAELELDVARSKLDIVGGNYKVFDSAKELMKHVRSKLR